MKFLKSNSLQALKMNSEHYTLIKFRRTNQDTCINLTPLVKKGEKVVKGQPLCQGYATENGELGAWT